MTLEPLTVHCPRCEAAPGEPCLKPDGRAAQGPHKARQDLAVAEAQRMRQRAEADAPAVLESPRWRRLYVAGRLELEQRGDWTTLAREQLEVLVRAMAKAEELRTVAENAPLTRGSTGQQVENPLWRTAERLDARALAIAKSLKLTADTRSWVAPPDDAGIPGGPEGEAGDELDELDELAVKRKAKAKAG